ncbi:Rpn family recombination-promoting nuclease/putative transposase [Aerosakkonema funiforme]|uniref:Rpn family recombination-promoting nuclease/putative transposase n=1 Tax=Aerosakkonema funiforme FACHB-1375 TaxID=2949571 RepID=A0A926V9S9_9CYAN|nr:Rpn family recombination-promoting nuclease/putative transposase [Aerosakkonema funiforme]MBD2179911.1 Rpn family recombination-promoting nuclease/putative transposase [Aerosakkonema funiforme FACHB-1375]
MYDNVCKFITEEFTADIATWLLGSPVKLTELSLSELSLEPIRADSLILQDVDSNLVLHLEFQTDPDPEIPFRMADYRLRVYRRFPEKRMRQIVIYLRKTNSKLVRQKTFSLENIKHKFEVIRLWERQPIEFLNPNFVGLLPFAVLSNTKNPQEILNQAAQLIEEIPEKRVQLNLVGTAAILAGLVLKEEVIKTILREDVMRESVIYQEILQTGLQRGIQQGIQQATEQFARTLLQRNMPVEEVASLTGLTIEQVQSLHNTVDNQ